MTRFGIVTSNVPSLTVVGRDIAQVIEKSGHQAIFFSRRIQWYDAKREFDRGIIFIPFDPLYAQLWFLIARDYCEHGMPSVVYTTVEGEPKKWLVRDWIKRDCLFIANSKFTERMLKKIGINITKVVYHGVNLDLVNKLKPEAETRKQQLKKELGVKVLFGTVASSHPRKGLKHLVEALQNVTSKIDDAGFYVLTTPKGRDYFTNIKNVKASPSFGKLEREDVMTMIGSFDYLLHPSLSEGFCLPVLEAQAFGVPCIFPAYDPITEIAHPTANFPVEIANADFQKLGDGILYLLHTYNIIDMVKQIGKAYETFTCNQEKYSKLSQQVTEHARNFDMMKTYASFMKPW